MKISKINNINDPLLKAVEYENLEQNATVEASVRSIIAEVIASGDSALIKYTNEFDQVLLDDIWVSIEEFEEAVSTIPEKFKNVIAEAKANIEEFHKKQLPSDWKITKGSVVLGQLVRPIEKVAVYVPGGKAAYPSSVLMNIIPAQIAGVKEITIVTPPDKNGKVNANVLYTAKELGINKVIKVGGAQGIAAVAYGTETVDRVDKIVGPGNVYVATAKKLVFGQVGIDMIAGPSEICILADETASPAFVAADLLSQAEHDEMARIFLVTTSEELALQAVNQLEIQTSKLPRKDIITSALQNNAYCFIVPDINIGISVCNKIAPEHLELMVARPQEQLSKIVNAGSIFLGAYSPEPLGDYYAGANHTLPTSGTARYASPLGVYDFIKRPSFIYYSKEDLDKVQNSIAYFAEVEGLYAHANAIKIRFEEEVKS
ncbi:MAG: histidinol dehydrogenase [Clostridiales bacterium]|nr:histidinol dehydrogenase [Clostridiales bacterium]